MTHPTPRTSRIDRLVQNAPLLVAAATLTVVSGSSVVGLSSLLNNPTGLAPFVSTQLWGFGIQFWFS